MAREPVAVLVPEAQGVEEARAARGRARVTARGSRHSAAVQWGALCCNGLPGVSACRRWMSRHRTARCTAARSSLQRARTAPTASAPRASTPRYSAVLCGTMRYSAVLCILCGRSARARWGSALCRRCPCAAASASAPAAGRAAWPARTAVRAVRSSCVRGWASVVACTAAKATLESGRCTLSTNGCAARTQRVPVSAPCGRE